jgi:hypothetical protein
MRPIRLIALLLVSLLMQGLEAFPAQAARRGREISIPTASSYPEGITSGPDGNLWFTEWAANKIGAIHPKS